MEDLFVRPRAQLRMHEGPLGPHIDAFIHKLTETGYARASRRRAVGLIGDFSRWLQQRGVADRDLTAAHVDSFLRARKRRRTPRVEDRPTLTRLMSHLAGSGVIIVASTTQALTPAQELEIKYVEYLRKERNLAPATVHANRFEARRLMASLLVDGTVTFADVAAADVIAHVRRVTGTCRPNTAGRVVCCVRSFLRFAYDVGLIGTDLSKCIPAPANWSLSSIPRALEEAQVRRILDCCDRATANGCRDHAIILLLARLGLRAGEVAALRLEDIDWRAGELRIRNGETRLDQLPLPHDVGDALAEYLRKGRPSCSTRLVFVRSQAPRQGFASGAAIASIVRRALQRADLDPPCKGAHALRHTLATQLLRKGASLAEIGEVLRHRRQRTTMIYAKVDLASLRSLAAPWPGGAQ